MEVPDAIAKVRQIAGWLLDRWTTDVVGRIVSTEEIGASAETLYTDGPRDVDWPAFVETDSVLLPAFGRGWVFVPEELLSVTHLRPRIELRY